MRGKQVTYQSEFACFLFFEQEEHWPSVMLSGSNRRLANDSEILFIGIQIQYQNQQVIFFRDILPKFAIHNLSQSLDIEQSPDSGISNFRIFGESFKDSNSYISRSRNDIDKKPRPITKRDKRITATSKNLTIRSFQKILTCLSFLRFMVNLQPSESRIPDTWFMKLTFSLIVTFYLTKHKNRTLCLYLHTNFQVCSTMLISFSQRGEIPPPPQPPLLNKY